MTQEERNLLWIDLSGRLRYGVMLRVYGQDGPKLYDFNEELYSLFIDGDTFSINDRGTGDNEGVCEIRPYLRPMGHMSTKEKDILHSLMVKRDDQFYYSYYLSLEAIDWLNEHHFDYRNLIDKGLALVAPDGMYEEIH